MSNVIIIHGNGGSTASDHWIPSLKRELEHAGIPTIARDFPDNQLARAKYWIPFLRDELKANHETIIVGHSSGAVCAMRFAEEYPLLGSVLVGGCYTDLGYESERVSGYYDAPWEWPKIRANQQWIAQFASSDDPWIPIEEARHIHKMLNTEYYEYSDRGHFGGDRVAVEFPECLELIMHKLSS